jgi:hypothetical protein
LNTVRFGLQFQKGRGDQERIDHVADVLDRVIAHDRDFAGAFVDLHLDDVAAVREGALAAGKRAALSSRSAMAFITAGSAPTVPDSPVPLTPSGLVSVGTSFSASAKGQKSSARGMA